MSIYSLALFVHIVGAVCLYTISVLLVAVWFGRTERRPAGTGGAPNPPRKSAPSGASAE